MAPAFSNPIWGSSRLLAICRLFFPLTFPFRKGTNLIYLKMLSSLSLRHLVVRGDFNVAFKCQHVLITRLIPSAAAISHYSMFAKAKEYGSYIIYVSFSVLLMCELYKSVILK